MPTSSIRVSPSAMIVVVSVVSISNRLDVSLSRPLFLILTISAALDIKHINNNNNKTNSNTQQVKKSTPTKLRMESNKQRSKQSAQCTTLMQYFKFLTLI